MVRKRIAVLPLIALLLFTTSNAQELPGKVRPADYLSDIRQVDFKNFTYIRRADEKRANAIRLRNSNYTSADGAQSFLMRITYGDLTGDGIEEAVVLLRGQNTRTSRTLDEVFIYTLEKGKVVLLTNFEGGKRGDYICSVNDPESNFKVENQRLILDLAVALEGDPQCDPTRYYTITYRWDSSRMIEVERSALKPLPEHRREVG
jgi:hypothetical protein